MAFSDIIERLNNENAEGTVDQTASFMPGGLKYDAELRMERTEPILQQVVTGKKDINKLTGEETFQLKDELNVLGQVLDNDLDLNQMTHTEAHRLMLLMGNNYEMPGLRQDLLNFAQNNQFGADKMQGILEVAADMNARYASADSRLNLGQRADLQPEQLAPAAADVAEAKPLEISVNELFVLDTDAELKKPELEPKDPELVATQPGMAISSFS